MADVRRIVVEFFADTKQLLSGFRKVDKNTSAITRAFRRMGVALAAAFGARALVRGFQQTVKSTESLIKTARGVGFTAKEYERLTFALSQVGVEAGSAKIAIGDFQKRLSKSVGGNKSFAKAFKEAGLDINALAAMSPAAAFEAAFFSLAGKLDDPRIAGLFGNVFEEQSGKDMLKAARSLGIFVDNYKAYGRIAGAGITKRDTANFEKLANQTRELSLRWTLLKRKIVSDAVPGILGSLERLQENGTIDAMSKGVAELTENIKNLTKAYIKTVEAFSKGPLDQSVAGFGGRLKTPAGEMTPQQAAEFAALEHQLKLNAGVIAPPGGIARPGPEQTRNQTINNVFNISGARDDKDIVRKVKNAVIDAQGREMVGQ